MKPMPRLSLLWVVSCILATGSSQLHGAAPGFASSYEEPAADGCKVHFGRGSRLAAQLPAVAVEWIDAGQGHGTPADQVQGGAVRSFKVPFAGDAVLYLRERSL